MRKKTKIPVNPSNKLNGKTQIAKPISISKTTSTPTKPDSIQKHNEAYKVLYKDRKGNSEVKVRQNTKEVKYDRLSKTGKIHDHEFVKVSINKGVVVEGAVPRTKKKK